MLRRYSKEWRATENINFVGDDIIFMPGVLLEYY